MANTRNTIWIVYNMNTNTQEYKVNFKVNHLLKSLIILYSKWLNLTCVLIVLTKQFC